MARDGATKARKGGGRAPRTGQAAVWTASANTNASPASGDMTEIVPIQDSSGLLPVVRACARVMGSYPEIVVKPQYLRDRNALQRRRCASARPAFVLGPVDIPP